jgi:cell division protein FtsB
LYKGTLGGMVQSPSPTPLRRKKPAPAAPPAWTPVRARLLNYVLVFVTVVLVVDALVGDKGLLDTMRARRQHAEISTAIGRLKQDNNRLRDEIRRYREDPSAIEALAREELGLMREGEVLFIVRDVKPFDKAQDR